MMKLLIVVVIVQSAIVAAWPVADRITSLSNLPFEITYENYAGYLDGGNIDMLGLNNATHHMFYWLTKFNGVASNSTPLIFWFNGGMNDYAENYRRFINLGPGCSSLGGLFTENGPFRVNQDNKTLYENVFAWNEVGIEVASNRNVISGRPRCLHRITDRRWLLVHQVPK